MNLRKNFKKLFTVLCILSSVFAMAQGNPQMIFPPNYWNPVGTSFSTSLPTNTVSTSYGTTILKDRYSLNIEGPSNMYADASGKPLFFVVGGFVFNPRGYLIDTLIDTLYSSFGSDVKRRLIAGGWADVCIVPNPANCTQYYIFTAVDYGSSAISGFKSCYQSNNTSYMEVAYKPCYALIDVSVQTPTANGAPIGELGKNVTPGASHAGRTIKDLYTATTPTTSTGDGYPDGCSPYPGPIHYACTQLIGGTKRFLYVSGYDELKVYQIDASGISFVHNYDLSSWTGDFIGDIYKPAVLSELEVNEDITNSKIHLALVGVKQSSGTQLIFADFSRSTGLIDTSTYKIKKVCFSGCANSTENITGVEFSPNGSYVYISRAATSGYSSTVMAISYSTPTSTTSISTDAGYSYSQIEAGTDGNLYLVNNGSGIDQITNPNSPGYITTGIIGLGGPTTVPQYSNRFNTGNVTPIAYMPDQIDGETYGSQFNNTLACCTRYNSYDKYVYSAGTAVSTWTNTATTQVWKPNTSTVTPKNPLAISSNLTSTVTIGQELRIPAGYTVTIQNMTIKFTPQATLIVEGQNGATNGGRLILKKCTLDVDTRCQTKMWPGVRVWGDSINARSYISKGYITIDSMSVIQNAFVGVELGYNTQYAATYGYKPADTLHSGGGNIVCFSSSFINNQRDIVFDRYQNSTGGVSNVYANTFVTNAYLLGGTATPICHIQLSDYKPNANIKGNNFSCSSSLTATGYVLAYKGIISINSNYTIDDNASPAGLSVFRNFSYGIYATNTGSNIATITAINSSFLDNTVGIYTGYINNSTIESDTFKIYQYGIYNASGIYLDNCTGYWVQDNYLTVGSLCIGSCRGSSSRYGIVASNSGAHANGIFRNTFKSLYKGSQAQYVNYYNSGGGLLNGTGLLYLCNIFSNNSISGADIYVPAYNSSANVGGSCSSCTVTAGIQYAQGAAGSATGANRPTADNQFSHTTSANDFYIEAPSTNTLTATSNYVFYCPAGTGTTTCIGSGYTSIYKPSNTSTGSNITLSTWTLSATPNCSTGGNGHRESLTPLQSALKEAALDKQLYDSLKVVFDAGIAEDLFAVNLQMSDAFTNRHLALDRAIRILINNHDDTSEVQAKAIMKEEAYELPARVQVETGIATHDLAMATQALSKVANAEGQSNYVKLHTILLQNFNKTAQQIMSNPSILSQVQAMDNDSSDRTTYLKANILLHSVGLSDYQPYYQPSAPDSSTTPMRVAKKQQNLLTDNSLYSKPNPFKESTIIKATIAEKTQNAFVVVTDMLGKEVNRYQLQQGDNEITFDGSELNQQVLFCSLIIDGVKIKTNKMVLIK